MLHRYAEKGIGDTRDATVRGIQKEAFEMVAAQHRRTLTILDQLRRAIEKFGAEPSLATQKASPVHRAPQSLPPLSQPSGGDADCAVLRDERASRAFMERDSSAWLRLVQRCERP
jgi:hypothetical protein